MGFPTRKNVCLYALTAGNDIVMVLMAIIFALQFTYDPDAQYLRGLVLEHLSLPGLLGYMWLHTDILHIVSNLIMLWIVGRCVCAKIGNANYFLVYLAVGTAAAIVHCAYDGRPVIGASGSIMGIVGMYVVLRFRRFSPAGPWIILVWFLLSVTCGIVSSSPIAYLAHCGGFVAGIVLVSLLMFFGIIQSDETSQSLLLALQRLRQLMNKQETIIPGV